MKMKFEFSGENFSVYNTVLQNHNYDIDRKLYINICQIRRIVNLNKYFSHY